MTVRSWLHIFFSLSSTSNNECLLKWLLVIEGIGYYHTYTLKNTLFQIERVPDFTLNVHTYIGSTYLFGIHQTFLNMNKVSTIICIYCSYRYLASDLKKVCTHIMGQNQPLLSTSESASYVIFWLKMEQWSTEASKNQIPKLRYYLPN